MPKEYILFQYYPNGNVVFKGSSSNPKRLQEKKKSLEERNPSAMYQIYER